MAATNEDALDELYKWDSRIDEMYERGVDHAAFDEDDALEAYEEIIQVGAASSAGAADSVLSLAAQLLTKHFDKFPHVNLNVVDVLLALCEASRPQAVRIHSVRSLLQIVKSGSAQATPLVLACRERIADVGGKLLQKETSNVLVRHLTQLQEAVVKLNEEVKKQEKKDKWAVKREQTKLKKETQKKEKQEKAAQEKLEKLEKEKTKREEDADRKSKRDAAKRDDKEKRDEKEKEKRDEKEKEKRNGDDTNKRREETRDGDHRRENNGREAVDRLSQNQQTPDKRNDRRASEDDRSRTREQRADSGSNAAIGRDRASNGNHNNAPGCPPSAYIFVGGLPRDTASRDIINYLSCIDESIDNSCVQIKVPNHGSRNGAGYAFVSLESTDHARKAIRHIQTTEFNGRKLIGDFARGPPCATLQFVERNAERLTHEVDAFPVVDFKKLDASIWDELTSTLKRHGPLEIVRLGCVRYRDVDSAKEVTRLPVIKVQGHSFLPVYDPQEQAEIDSSKRRPRSSSGADVDRERRGSDLSRYGGRPADHRAVDRRDSRDFSRRSPPTDQRNEKPRRSASPGRRGGRELGEKQDRRHNSQYSEFDQSRYGPRDAVKTDLVNARDARERSPTARRASMNTSPRRSRSRSPVQRNGGDRTNNERIRSRSPARRRPSEEDRRCGDDRRLGGESTQVLSRGGHDGRKSSPPRGRRNSPPRRGSEEQRRSRSPVSRREMFEKKYGRTESGKVSSPPRGRSRSPRRNMSPHSTSENARRGEESRHDELKHPRSRSRSPRQNSNNRDEPAPSRRMSGDQAAPDVRRDDEHRQRNTKQQQNERVFVQDRPRGRREENAPKMSKYGTVKGSGRSPRSPPAARTHAERSRSRDSNRLVPDRADDRLHRRASSISETANNGNSADKRDQRASPPRYKKDDRNIRQERGRSPPRSPRSLANRDRPSARSSPARSRSPPRMTGHKRERSRSPLRRQGPADDDRRPRGGIQDKRDARRDQEQRQPNHANSPDRRRPKTEDRAREADKRDHELIRAKTDPPHKDAPDSARGKADQPRKEERSKRDGLDAKRRSPPASPVLRDQRQRSESPVPSTRVSKSTTASAEIDTKPKNDSPRAVAQSSKTASIYDIDECMVDYEEDED